MRNPAKANPARSDVNLLLATIGLVVCSGIAAGGVYFLTDFVLASMNSSNAMAMIIGDAGKIASDDATLERNLSTATIGLRACRDVGLALAVGCLGVGVAVVIRIRRQNAPKAQPRG